MTLRRLGLAVPLAILVALLVHLATFGLGHAPAGRHAAHLVAGVAAALALAALSTVLFVALRRRREHDARNKCVFPLDLTFGGAFAYATIEWSEGHMPFGYGWPLFTLFAIVALVYGAALLLERALRYCGEALAALADRIAPSYRSRIFFATASQRPLVARNRCARSSRGRAPPLFT